MYYDETYLSTYTHFSTHPDELEVINKYEK